MKKKFETHPLGFYPVHWRVVGGDGSNVTCETRRLSGGRLGQMISETILSYSCEVSAVTDKR